MRGTSRKEPAEITFGDLLRTAFFQYFKTGSFATGALDFPVTPFWNTLQENTSRGSLEASLQEGLEKLLSGKGLPIPARLDRIISTHLTPLYDRKTPGALVIFSSTSK